MLKPRIQHYSKFWNEVTYEGSSLIYVLTKNGELPNVGVDYLELKPNTKLKPHYHEGPTVLILILEGTGLIHLDGTEYEIKKGDVINIPPKATHGFISKEEKLVFLSIQTPPIYGEEADKDTHFVD